MKSGWIIRTASSFFLFVCAGMAAGDESILPTVPEGNPASSAYKAFRDERITEALNLYVPLAEKGDADANFLMAYAAEVRNEAGPSGASRLQVQGRHYGIAAAKGNPEAVYRLMLMRLISGEPGQREAAKQDLETAAAEDGNSRAWRVLGEAWLKGAVNGTPDPKKAIEWWKKAADAGDADVLVPLGNLLFQEKDEAAGRQYLEKAIQKGRTEAYGVLGDYEAEEAKDISSAKKAYLRGSEAGNGRCMLKLSELLEKGGKDEESRDWLQKGAASGNPLARYRQGKRLLAEGESHEKEAFALLMAAANDGIWTAQYDVGMMLLEGRLGVQDPVSAAAWLTKAAASGDPETQYQLGLIHEWGYTGLVNYSNVGILYSLASNGGHAKASGRLARMAYDGIRVKSNLVQAWAFAKLAIERGDQTPEQMFAELDGKLDETEKKKAREFYAKLLEQRREPPERLR